MNQDLEHLRLLSIFHYVVAGITALFACIPFIHVFIGIAALVASPAAKCPSDHFPAAFGWLFIVFGGLAILAGWTMAVLIFLTGRFLAARRKRIFCLVIAAIECTFMPFGTVLGIFTIIVLVRPSVQAIFEGADMSKRQS